MSVQFIPYPKTPRLFRDMVITEKIDGTNAAIQIVEAETPEYRPGMGLVLCEAFPNGVYVAAQSRKRLINSGDDNFGFARWVQDNALFIVETLGVGVHFGEWWGSGIQRGYGLPKGEKRFSLFNVSRWEGVDLSAVPGLGVVPVLRRWTFNTDVIDDTLQLLREEGSFASPGFMNPEGVVVYHGAANQCFKVLLENDELPKGHVA